MRPTSWVPPALWMVIVLALSSDTGSAANTGRWIGPILQLLFPQASPLQIDAMHGALRKLGHVVEYAIMVLLWYRGFVREGRAPFQAAGWAWIIAAAWAAIDEGYQSTVGSRTGSPFDVLIDVAGASAAAVPAAYGWRPTAERLATILLWIAAVGGVGLLVLNLAAGVASGLLWLTAPAAVVALALVRRRANRRPRS